MNVTRRALFHKTLRVAGSALGVGGIMAAGHVLLRDRSSRYPVNQGRSGQQRTRLIRPPGAVPEEPFLAGCIRCYKCQDACEIGAIRFFTESEGRHFHTPYVDPSVKACNLCMKCTTVCPTGVLENMAPSRKAEIRMATVELDRDLCLSFKAKRIRNEQALLLEVGREATEAEGENQRRGPCGECHMFCPLRGRAIRLEPGAFLAPMVFPEHCAGCGLCEEICRVMVRGDPAIRVLPTRPWS